MVTPNPRFSFLPLLFRSATASMHPDTSARHLPVLPLGPFNTVPIPQPQCTRARPPGHVRPCSTRCQSRRLKAPDPAPGDNRPSFLPAAGVSTIVSSERIPRRPCPPFCHYRRRCCCVYRRQSGRRRAPISISATSTMLSSREEERWRVPPQTGVFLRGRSTTRDGWNAESC